MRSLFKRLNIRGEKLDISTFSKASKVRSPDTFKNLLIELKNSLRKAQGIDLEKFMMFPVDSTIVTLTSKLFYLD
jgi:hypothetical protein